MNIQVLILAGGVGKRTWPIKKNKNLLPFFGKPLIEHQIESLRKAGFEELKGINTYYALIKSDGDSIGKLIGGKIEEAVKAGADYLIVGRSIILAKKPAEAAEEIRNTANTVKFPQENLS